MKISEFAAMNNVTTKMLRHYDEIGLLKPSSIDVSTGYRSYEVEQCQYINWITILKNLNFSLVEIKEMLNGPISSEKFIKELIHKRIEISLTMNEQIEKKIQIDKLIKIIESEGFQMDKKINLLSIEQENVNEIKKNMPNMEMFLEDACNIASLCAESDNISVMRLDISHFKQVNDNYGFDVGDKVIVAIYDIIKANFKEYKNYSAIGRAHGDEFVVFAKAKKEEVEKTIQAIISDINSYNFSDIGCKKQIGCYIGSLVGKEKTITDIRKMLEGSIETINEARKNGENSFVIQNYTL